MCGIVGILGTGDGRELLTRRMADALRHRGPDGDGYYSDDFFAGGMRRLAINDIVGGGQPLFNGDKSIVLLYNGEIYNYPQLRKLLESRGKVFRTHSDGEIIPHLYEDFGEAAFEQLDGMFSLALWDIRERKLILARDLPGEKPLYYSQLPNAALVFASEIKAFNGIPGLPLTLDRQAIWDLPTFLWIPEPNTVFEEVRALPRGHILVACADEIRIQAYRNTFDTGYLPSNEDELIAETRQVITESVRSRLLSDVPIGSFLSGGLDSSIVATLATRELGHIDTFSVGFENLTDPYHGTVDESEAAAEYAATLGSRHHLIRVTGDTFRKDLDLFCRHGDQPFAVSSGLGILSVARAAHEHGIKVLLSGDCADECFGGYSWHSHLPGNARTGARVELAKGEVVSFQNFGSDLFHRLDALAQYPAQERAWAWHYYAHESEKDALFDPQWSAGMDSSLRHFYAYKSESDWQAEDYVAHDRNFYMPNEMLRKVDRMTMAFSVEARVPFAAPAVLAHADKLSLSHMVRGDTLKWVLRKAFEDILPRELTDRPKHGFNVPIDHWLTQEWSDLVDDTFGDGSAIRRLKIVRADSGDVARAMLRNQKRLNGHTIFCFIMLNRWLEESGFGDHC